MAENPPYPQPFAARLAELHANTERTRILWEASLTEEGHVAFINAREDEGWYLRNHSEAILALVEPAALKRNVISHPDFPYPDWVVIPREDFDRLRAALSALEEKE